MGDLTNQSDLNQNNVNLDQMLQKDDKSIQALTVEISNVTKILSQDLIRALSLQKFVEECNQYCQPFKTLATEKLKKRRRTEKKESKTYFTSRDEFLDKRLNQIEECELAVQRANICFKRCN